MRLLTDYMAHPLMVANVAAAAVVIETAVAAIVGAKMRLMVWARASLGLLLLLPMVR